VSFKKWELFQWQSWTIDKPGYQISGGLNDRGFYDDLVVERPLQS
jgi:hypothetical protein